MPLKKAKSNKESPKEASVDVKTVYDKRHRGSPFWGLILVASGITLLLNSLGFLPWTVWADIIQLWPILIIFFGLQIFFRGSNWVIDFLIALLLLAAVGWCLYYLISGTPLFFSRGRLQIEMPHMQQFFGNPQINF